MAHIRLRLHFALSLLLMFLFFCNQKDDKLKSSIVLKFGHDMPVGSPLDIASQRFAESVKLKTSGRITIEVYPNQELGTDPQMIQMAIRGDIDIIIPPVAKLGHVIPNLGSLDLPYLFESREQCFELLDGPLGWYYFDEIEKKGLKGVSFWESGFKQITSNKELKRGEEIRFRVMNSTVLKDMYKSVGFQPIHIDFHSVKEALKEKRVDAQENPIISIYTMEFHKFQKYLYLTNHSFLGQVLLFSSALKGKISPMDYEILVKVGQEVAHFQRKITAEKSDEFLSLIKKDYPIIIKELPRMMQERLITFRDRELKKFPVVDSIVQSEENSYTIGLDLSLSGKTANSGLSIQNGVQLALQEINAKGGVLGKRLRYITLDNQGFPAKGISNINEFSQKKGLIGVMGGMHSPVAIKELSLIHEQKIPFLIPWAAATVIVSHKYKPNMVFRLSVRDEYAGEFLVKKTVKKYRKVALVLENTAWGKGNEKSLNKALKKYKRTHSGVYWFNWGTISFSKIITQMENDGVEAVYFVGNAPEGVTFVRDLYKMKSAIKVISHWGITGGTFFEEAKEFLGNVDLTFLQTFTLTGNIKAQHKEFADKIRELAQLSSEGVIKAPVGAIHAYELTHLFALAVNGAGSVEPLKIRASLKNISEYHGVFKVYKKPFHGLQEALDINDFTLCQYDSIGNISEVR